MPVQIQPLPQSTGPSAVEFNHLDYEFIRVVEDLIDVLILKGVLRITDLPPGAQRKLNARKDLRGKLRGALELLDGDHAA